MQRRPVSERDRVNSVRLGSPASDLGGATRRVSRLLTMPVGCFAPRAARSRVSGRRPRPRERDARRADARRDRITDSRAR